MISLRFATIWKAAFIFSAVLLALCGEQGRGAAAEPLPRLQDIKAVSVGLSNTCGPQTEPYVDCAAHVCAVTNGGMVVCWGNNGLDNLGSGAPGEFQVMPMVTPGLEGVETVAVGSASTCVLTAAGGVKCWGRIGGDGTDLWRDSPVDVTGLSSGVTAIGVGYNHACALLGAGGVKCWGVNDVGQLGTGVQVSSRAPVDVVGLEGRAVAIGAGYGRTCALTDAGSVQCWGDGVLLPTEVPGLAAGVQAISVGLDHACAILLGGRLQCWGGNEWGQLGNGNLLHSSTPVDVAGLGSGVRAVSAGGGLTCALTDASGVQCWGINDRSQVGDGTQERRLTPVAVMGLRSGVTAISAGTLQACAVTDGGGVQCWGDNAEGLLGDGTTSEPHRATGVIGLGAGATGANVTSVATGENHTCAVAAGGVLCWGANDAGQVGDGTTAARPTPVAVVGLGSGVKAVSAGYRHTCALTAAGGVWCWGFNKWGQLGDGTREDRTVPVEVQGLDAGVQAISAGMAHTCVLTAAGGVKCWGVADFAHWTADTTPPDAMWLTPAAIAGLATGVQAIAAGDSHTCALLRGGLVKCWGDNRAGQLGDGTKMSSVSPVSVAGLPRGVQAIGAGAKRAYAFTTSGSVLFWGYLFSGSNGDMVPQFPPTRLEETEDGMLALYPGESHSCALFPGSVLKCWGWNRNGQLGNGTAVNDKSPPVAVAGLYGPVQAAPVGALHTCAVTEGGRLQCWGYNRFGQLGVTTWAPREVAAALAPGQYLPWVQP